MKSKKCLVLCLIGIVSIIIMAVLFTFVAKKVDKSTANLDQETLKAMTYGELTDADSRISNCDYVQFSAFFTRDLDGDGNANKLNGTCKSVNDTDMLYAELKVLSKGYLKDGTIALESSNFSWTTAIVSDTVVKGNYIGITDKLNLQSEVLAGSEKLFYGKITPKITNINDYSKINTITLHGIYVDESGMETEITKTVNLTVDWYGEVETKIYPSTNTIYYDQLNVNDEGEMTVEFTVYTREMKEELILKENILEVKTPKINGYYPVDVKVISDVTESSFDSESGILTLKRSSEVTESGNIVTQIARKNYYTIQMKYSKEVHDSLTSDAVVYEIPVISTYTAYNNSNKEFINPISFTAQGIDTLNFSVPDGKLWNCYVTVGKYTDYKGYVVLKDKVLKVYNNQLEDNDKDYYNVRWKLYTSRLAKDGNTITKAVLKEQEDKKVDEFLSVDGSYVSMEDYIANVGIYFSGLSSALSENGYIKIYNDESNELIETFTKEDFNTYTESNPYMYSEKIKHIRAEISEISNSSVISIINIKELDDKKIVENISKEEFDNYVNIYTYLNGNVNFKNAQSDSKNDIESASYGETESSLKVTLTPEDITNQEMSKNQKIVLTTQNEDFNQAKWKNAEFLVKLPKEILAAEINSITSSVKDVEILGYSLYKEEDCYFIKILTSNDIPTHYSITIDCNLTPNPIEATKTEPVEVYTYNENCTNYKVTVKDAYDINGNNNTIENIGYSAARLQMIAPSTLLTSETVTNYDVLGEDKITNAPNIAKITKSQGSARINVIVNNYYSGTISNTKILGQIPYEGNKYIITGGNLGSEFSSQMNESGIRVPNELEKIAKIYYTENVDADVDLTKEENGWTQTPSDWSKVKRYLIDLGDYKIPQKTEYTFSYDITIPDGIDYYKVSYSDHAIYFSLDTQEGKLQTQTEPNKVGIQISRRYKLKLTKNKAGTDTVVPGATYRLIEKDENGGILSRFIATTDLDGEILIDNLNINRTYELKELKAPSNYALNSDEISFTVREGYMEHLEVIVNSDAKFAKEPTIEIPAYSKDVVNVFLEDEPKYKLQITKMDEQTSENIKGVKFKILETLKEYITDENGILTISDLALNNVYTLQEIKADGYYLPEQDKQFKLIVNEEGNYELVSDSLSDITIDSTLESPVVKTIIKNEKVPTYEMEILKVSESDENNTGLKGAKYQITSEDTQDVYTFLSDEEGKIQINNLYQFIEGKNATGKYTLQEITSPNGYATNIEKISFKVVKTEDGLSIEVDNKDKLTSLKSTTIEENKVKIILQDRPLFKLTKIDEDTKKPMANVSFAIYETTVSGEVVDYAKDINGNYVGDKNSNGIYIVKTDENGEISLALPAGYFKAVEVEATEGYNLPENEADRTTYFKTEGLQIDLQINSVEDLVDFSNAVNAGESYEGKKVELMRSLDFNDDSCYDDPNDTSYGDYNGNGIVEGIKQELTNTSGIGFIPIGTETNPFKGGFDGNRFEITNAIFNSSSSALFEYISNSEITNLGVNNIVGKNVEIFGGIVYHDLANSIISNCYNKGNINIKGYAAGIILDCRDTKIKSCYNTGNITSESGTVAGIAGQVSTDSKTNYIYNCYNTGNLSSGGNNNISGISAGYSNIVSYCYNTGKIETKGNAAGVIYQADLVENCYNSGEINGGKVVGSCIGGIVSDAMSDNIINNCYNIGDINISGARSIGGIVASCQDNTVNISNCFNKGNIISDYMNIGGISGEYGNVKNCYNTGDITGTGLVGGIAGNGAYIEECYNIGKINGKNYTGGIVGNCNYVKNSYNLGSVTGTNWIGGIGGLSTLIENCYNKGEVIGESFVGGISGWSPVNYISKVFNKGNIYGKDDIGGISGSANCYNAYNTGKIEGTNRIGGIIANGCVYNSYNQGQVIGSEDVGGIATNSDISTVYNIGKTQGNSKVGQLVGDGRSVAKSFYINSENVKYYGADTPSSRDEEVTAVDLEYIKTKDIVDKLNEYKNEYTGNNTLCNWIYKAGDYPTLEGLDEFTLDIDVNIDMPTSLPRVNITPTAEITVENAKRQFKITTEVGYNSGNARSGGTITGVYNEEYKEENNIKFVEQVKYNENNSEAIQIKPDENYSITEIKINGDKIQFTPNESGTVNLDVGYFENISENKHIKVVFEKDVSKIVVHHYLKDRNNNYTTTALAEDEEYYGKIDEKYNTQPRTDIKGYELEKDSSENYVIPTNASGTYINTVQEINYYYQELDIKLIVHHYLDGTNNKLDDDIVEKHEKGYEYTTTPSSKVLESYNLSSVDGNENDVLNEDTEVTYYYSVKKYNITTEVKKHKENKTNILTNEKEEIMVEGGKISGKDKTPYEEVEYGQNSKNEIKITPDKNYTVKTITLISINEEKNETSKDIYGDNKEETEITYTENEDGTIILSNFENVKENKHIVVEFVPIEGTVKVHHIIRGEIEDYQTQTKNDLIGEPYSSNEINITGYKLVETSKNTSGKYTKEDIDVYYYYDLSDYTYTVHYFYDGIEDQSKMETKTAEYKDQISAYTDKVIDGYALEKVKTEDNKDLPLTITENIDKNIINVYYKTQFKITTDVIEHTETYRDGTKIQNIKGGSISGEDLTPYEKVFKGDKPQNEIKIKPDSEYVITKVIIKSGETEETKLDLTTLTYEEDGSLIIPQKYIVDETQGMQSNKHIEVEFRKKTTVIVQYLEKETKAVLYKTEDNKEYEEISGYETKKYTTTRKLITNYKPAEVEAVKNSENVKANITYNAEGNDITAYNDQEEHEMCADTVTVTYWYERIPSGIIVRHIELNEKDKKDGLTLESGIELESETIEGYVSLSQKINRRIYNKTTNENEKYKNYISVEGPVSSNENIIILGKDDNEKTVTYKDGVVVEARYYYERQYNITTKVKKHTEIIDGAEKEVSGGTISGDGLECYEKINKMASNENKIEIIPEDGYKVKTVTINDQPLDVKNMEDENHKITLEKEYFKEVIEDKNIVVEFEKIPAKVIVKYKDADTKEEISNQIIKDGYVHDIYTTSRLNIETYILAQVDAIKEGISVKADVTYGTTEDEMIAYEEQEIHKLTENQITVTYWYTKQFTITTDVIEHMEIDKDGNKKYAKGGMINGEDSTPYETVTRGKSNEKEIKIKPDEGYRIKEIRINDEILDYEKDENINIEENIVKIPEGYLKNMQEDKKITVEYEKIPAKVIVKYLDEETGETIYKTEGGQDYDEVNGVVGDSYKTEEKSFKYYELVKEKYPKNSEGTLTKENITVEYYYRKLKFNMKIDKEIDNIILNNEKQNITNNEKEKIEIDYNNINDTNLEITYRIKITNTEKVEGTAIIEEDLPNGFEFVKEKSSMEWVEKDGKYSLQTPVIEAEEIKEYLITVKWNASAENIGEKENTVSIIVTENEPRYDETTKEDNKDSAVIIIKVNKTIIDNIKEITKTIKTGDTIIVSVLTLLTATIILVIINKRKCK